METQYFASAPKFAGDPVFDLQSRFLADTRADKVNLGIGVYLDEHGQLPLLTSVQQALAQQQGEPRPYLPLEGDLAYRDAAAQFVFGPDHTAIRDQRIATIQTLGGTGGVSIAAEFLRRFTESKHVLLSNLRCP